MRKIFCVFLLLLPAVLFGSDSLRRIEREFYIYHASTEQFIPQIDSSIAEARRLLIKILDDSLSYKPKIFIENNVGDFRKRIGTAFPDWGAAVAMPYRETIVLKSPAHFNPGKSLRELVKHEYAHLALHHKLPLTEPPRWLDEGVAMYTAYEWGWSANFAMSRAVVFNTLVPLKEIDRLNLFSAGRAQTAYAESYLAVKYLLDNYGKESFYILLDTLRATRSVEEAMSAAVGGSTEEFEKEFFAHLEKRYNIMSLFGDLYFIWLFLAAVIVIGYFMYFLKKKRYYKKWEDEEKYHSTDFDYGDPDDPEAVDDEDKPWN